MKKITVYFIAGLISLFSSCTTVKGSFHYTKGSRCLEYGKYEEACAHLEKSVELVPFFCGSHSNLALAYSHLGEMEKAWIHLRKAYLLEPSQFTISNLAIFWENYKTKLNIGIDTPKEEIIQVLGYPDFVYLENLKASCLLYGTIFIYLVDEKCSRIEIKQ